MENRRNKHSQNPETAIAENCKKTFFTKFESFIYKFKIIRNFLLINLSILLGIILCIIYKDKIPAFLKEIINIFKDKISQFKIELSWPLIVLFSVLLFRKAISNFLDRIKSIKNKYITINMANEKTVKSEIKNENFNYMLTDETRLAVKRIEESKNKLKKLEDLLKKK